jgi:DNA-directed RNA polymerase specialized sigma24 family protein
VRKRNLIGELELLYRERYRQFLRVATAIVGDEAAHDVVQEAFTRAIRSSGSYRGEGTVEAWLWQVLVNAARAARPSQAPALSLDEDAAFAVGNGSPDDEFGIRGGLFRCLSGSGLRCTSATTPISTIGRSPSRSGSKSERSQRP